MRFIWNDGLMNATLNGGPSELITKWTNGKGQDGEEIKIESRYAYASTKHR